MSLAVLANHMASKGRNGDTMLVHMAPEEVAGLHALALKHGGSLTINPETGLPEAFSLKGLLKSLLPAIAGFALAPLTAGTSLAFLGATPLASALTVGGITGLAKGSLKEGIMAGLGAYGGASLGAGLSAAGEAGLQAAAGEAALKETAGYLAEAPLDAAKFVQQQVAEKAAAMTPYDKIAAGVSNLGTEAGRQNLMASFGSAGGQGAVSNIGRTAALAAAPIMADAMVPTNIGMPNLAQPRGEFYDYTFAPGMGYQFQGIRRGASGGLMGSSGIVALAAGGPSLPSDVGTYTPEQKADLYNKFLSQGFNDAAIRQAAGQQTDTDWQTLQQLAAQRGSPAVSGAERTVLTSPIWTSVGGQTGIAGLNQNIQNFVQQNPNIAYPQIAAAAQQYGVDTEDIRRAIAAGGGSGGLQNVLTQADWRSRTGLTGLEGMNKNIQMWMAENPQATEAQIRQAMAAVDINEADVLRATGMSVAELAY